MDGPCSVVVAGGWYYFIGTVSTDLLSLAAFRLQANVIPIRFFLKSNFLGADCPHCFSQVSKRNPISVELFTLDASVWMLSENPSRRRFQCVLQKTDLDGLKIRFWPTIWTSSVTEGHVGGRPSIGIFLPMTRLTSSCWPGSSSSNKLIGLITLPASWRRIRHRIRSSQTFGYCLSKFSFLTLRKHHIAVFCFFFSLKKKKGQWRKNIKYISCACSDAPCQLIITAAPNIHSLVNPLCLLFFPISSPRRR